jgi:hypothetical protein
LECPETLKFENTQVNFMCTQKEANLDSNGNTLESDRLQHDRTATCDIAQQ